MIRITTDRAISATLRRHATILATQYADAIEAMPYEGCAHNDRPACPRCATRLTVLAAAAVVRRPKP